MKCDKLPDHKVFPVAPKPSLRSTFILTALPEFNWITNPGIAAVEPLAGDATLTYAWAAGPAGLKSPTVDTAEEVNIPKLIPGLAPDWPWKVTL